MKTSLIIALGTLLLPFHFAFSQTDPAPGGVADGLQIWLRGQGVATSENSKIDAWFDASGFRRSSFQSEVDSKPTWIFSEQENVNGHPVLSFDGFDDFLSFDQGDFDFAPGNVEAFIVKKGNRGNGHYLAGGVGPNTLFQWRDNGVVAIGSDSLQLPDHNAFAPVLIHVKKFGSFLAGQVNASPYDSTDSGLWTGVNQPVALGRLGGTAAEYFEGWIAELILYNRQLTKDEVLQVQTYLALKYGLTINQAYVASDQAFVWSQHGHPEFAFRVAGIGRDNASGLHQSSSKSLETGTILQVSSREPLDDLDFLVWGSADSTITERPAVVNGNSVRVLRQQWHMHRRHDPGLVDITFDLLNATVSGTTVDDFWLAVGPEENVEAGVRSVYPASSFDGRYAEFEEVHIEDDNNLSLITHNPGGDVINVASESEDLPSDFTLGNPFPNPFSHSARINYEVPDAGSVEITLYDLLGRPVKTLVNRQHAPGRFSITLNGARLASGIYYLRLRSGSKQLSRAVTHLP